MKTNIFVTKEVYNNFLEILNNLIFTLKKYWIKRVRLENILNTNWKIQYKTANTLLMIYNDYYKENLTIEDIFHEKYLINYKKSKKISFEFSNDNWFTFMDGFIDEILSIIESVFWIKEKIINKSNNLYSINKTQNKNTTLLYIIMGFLLIYSHFYIIYSLNLY